MNYYSEHDDFAADWLENLIETGRIPNGKVDRRSIVEVQADDVRGFTQCHFFAGIGGWPLALQLAGWAPHRPVWTGSCPCQPFSQAGKQKAQKDERHLWPEMYRLIRECRPVTVFGEQVASAIGHGWLDGISDDLERENYAVGSIVLGAFSVGAPQKRARLFWVADSAGVSGAKYVDDSRKREAGREDHSADCCRSGAWSDYRIVHCRDGNSRRVERGVQPLVNGIPRRLGRGKPELWRLAKRARANRVGRLRGYGNAIVPQVAAKFVMAFMDCNPQ